MVAKALNTLGLMLNITGVIILFFFSYPQPTHEESVGLALESATVLPDGRTVAEHGSDAQTVKANYLLWSKFGLILIIVGFMFQLIGTWCHEKSEWL